MKNLINLISLLLLFSGNHSDSKKITITKNEQNTNSVKGTNSIANSKTDTALLMNKSTEILAAVKAKNYKNFISFIHPQYGIRFSPYANIDTTKDRKFFGNELLMLAKQNKKTNWNSGWDEEPELLTIDQYFSKFVYDVDFLNAKLKSVNKYHSQGTDLNNIEEVYPECDVIEFFFPGFEKKYEGMDFRGLRLVFKMEGNIPYLIGIVHDKWTP